MERRPDELRPILPISKAIEILGERWTFLIIRELLMGGRRFSELQRGLGDISPALLTARLKSFESEGLVVRRRVNGQRGFEYYPTRACEELRPIIIALGEWGLCWARNILATDYLDVDMLLLYLERSIDPEQLPGNETVIQFKFNDLIEQRDWWLLVRDGKVEVCITRPGRDVDVFFSTSVQTMSEVWMGQRTYRQAVLSGDLVIEGDLALTRRISTWASTKYFRERATAGRCGRTPSGPIISQQRFAFLRRLPRGSVSVLARAGLLERADRAAAVQRP